MGTFKVRRERACPSLIYFPGTPLLIRWVDPKSGILMESSVVRLTEDQITGSRLRGEACDHDSLHDPSWSGKARAPLPAKRT